MELLTKEEFAELASHESDCSVSIYLPVHESGVEVNERQDVIVLKNLLAEAASQLINRGLSAQKAAQFLEPATALIKNEEFWLNLSRGLGLLISQGFFRILHLPFSVKAGVYNNNSFHLS